MVALDEVPAAHCVHEVAPDADHLPAPHGVAAEVVGHSDPAGHVWHVPDDFAPTTVEYSPAAHDVQGASPVADHVPALQGKVSDT